ncbi:hypothetical protein N7462_009081, partial [Penicillium macrosclerotiorum]|uniref:uncharacterized protein n=1 Tax=Penicillium macrosclerotiorum TaxID=303699 RepID=UPI002547072E
LYAPELPERDSLEILIGEYFTHIHPLRCFGFIHKPSFMQHLDEDLESCRNSESLLHVVCAMGAKLYALNYAPQLSPETVLMAGSQWAKIAKARLFVDLDDLSIEKLMTAILLYEHDLRIGSYASAFMLSGVTARMSQALQLNLESSADLLCFKEDSTPIVNEARRRLMWSCYVMDSWVGSGVNQLTLLEDRDLKIQLPCHTHNFSLGIPCITEILEAGKVVNFVLQEQVPTDPSQNMGIEAYFIRLVSSRKKVLRQVYFLRKYVKHLDNSAPPWQDDSEFSQLSAEFDSWKASLPQSLIWNPGAIYARKESSQLGALTLLWCTYHQTLVDLYRIGMPTLFRIQKRISFPPNQQEFLDDCRRACFDNALAVSNIISEGLRHGVKVLTDTWFCIITHDSTKVMLYFLKLNEQMSRGLEQSEVQDTLALVQKNAEALMHMRPIVATAEHCYISVVKMMATAGIKPYLPQGTMANPRDTDQDDEISPTPGSTVQESPENILNPLAIYRMARTALHEKDARTSSKSPSAIIHISASSTSKTSRQEFYNGSAENAPFHTDAQTRTFEFSNRSSIIDGPFYLPDQQRHNPSLAWNNFSQLRPTGNAGNWDLTDLAMMDILDGGISPWTAEYLTDGQSGIDPFLFPF